MNRTLEKIFYVDDDDDIRTIACMALESLGGFKVTSCASGADALKIISSVNPQIILLDIMMPDMDGLTLLTHIRKDPLFSITPVIFMTAKNIAQDTEASKFNDIAGIIKKPFNPMTLADEIRVLWDKSRNVA